MQNRNPKIKRIALMGMLFAAAIALSFLESLLPALPFLPPGVKLGLSNIVTMYAVFVLGPKAGYSVAVMKSLFVFLTRSLIAASMSLAGGLVSVTVMLLLSRLPSVRTAYLLLSVFGAISHNLGQLIVARFVVGSGKVILSYLPLLVISGAVMGVVTGLVLKVVMPHIQKLQQQ